MNWNKPTTFKELRARFEHHGWKIERDGDNFKYTTKESDFWYTNIPLENVLCFICDMDMEEQIRSQKHSLIFE